MECIRCNVVCDECAVRVIWYNIEQQREAESLFSTEGFVYYFSPFPRRLRRDEERSYRCLAKVGSARRDRELERHRTCELLPFDGRRARLLGLLWRDRCTKLPRLK